MAENSKIEWTHHTFNPWFGCTKVSEGCAHCYAEQSSPAKVARSKGQETWGKGAPRIRTSAANWQQPLKWDRDAAACRLLNDGPWKRIVSIPKQGRILMIQLDSVGGGSMTCEEWDALPRYRPRVFCASLADWLDDEVPIEWLADLMELIVRTPHLDWLLLTKRPQNWERRITDALAHVEGITGDWPNREPYSLTGHWLNEWTAGNAPANVWIGTTVENQARADERIPQLLSIPAVVRFLSCEPLLSKVDLVLDEERLTGGPDDESVRTRIGPHGIHWVICGGESGGPKARPMHPNWARSLRDQCSAAGVPFFFKQWGDWACITEGTILAETTERPRPWHCLQPDDRVMGKALMRRVGKAKAGRLLDGRTHDEFPKVERITAA